MSHSRPGGWPRNGLTAAASLKGTTASGTVIEQRESFPRSEGMGGWTPKPFIRWSRIAGRKAWACPSRIEYSLGPIASAREATATSTSLRKTPGGAYVRRCSRYAKSQGGTKSCTCGCRGLKGVPCKALGVSSDGSDGSKPVDVMLTPTTPTGAFLTPKSSEVGV
eukprot:scaffold2688_cov235-Pinguiococcus_pyrenoidosus.AAC.1